MLPHDHNPPVTASRVIPNEIAIRAKRMLQSALMANNPGQRLHERDALTSFEFGPGMMDDNVVRTILSALSSFFSFHTVDGQP